MTAVWRAKQFARLGRVTTVPIPRMKRGENLAHSAENGIGSELRSVLSGGRKPELAPYLDVHVDTRRQKADITTF